MAFPILGTPKPQFFDSSGAPLSGGTLTIVEPSTDVQKATYPTYDDAEAATNPNDNPLTLDARGECDLWGLDNEDYKVTVKDSNGATIWTTDDIFMPTASRYYAITSAETTAGVTPTNYEYAPGNVLRYGATGDGVTDDTTAIENALASNNDVYLPSGTYYIAGSTITLDANTNLRGDGDATLITSDGSARSTPSTDHLFIATSNCTIRDLSINGDRFNATDEYRGIWADDGDSDISILNVTFIDHGRAIWLAWCDRVLIDGCRFLNDVENKGGVVTSGSVSGASTNVTVANCYFGETQEEAIDVNSNTQWMTIADNFFYKNHTDTTDPDGTEVIDIGATSKNCHNFTITGNVCDGQLAPDNFIRIKQGTTHVTIANNVVRNIKAAGDAAFFLSNCLNVSVIGNTVDTAPALVKLTQYSTTTRTQTIVISGNTITNAGTRGIWIDDSFGTAVHLGVSITGNTMYGTSATNEGIYVVDGDGVVISGNYIDNFDGDGIRVLVPVVRFAISGNTIVRCADGISIEGGGEGSISGNSCSTNTASGMDLNAAYDVTVTANVCKTNTSFGVNFSAACTDIALTGNCLNNNTSGAVGNIANLSGTNISNAVSAAGTIDNVGQVGPFAYMSTNSGRAVFAGYDYDAAAVIGLQLGGTHIQFPTATGTVLDDITDAINTSAAKVEGAMVFNTTANKPVYAVGAADGDVWVDGAGTTTNTPV